MARGNWVDSEPDQPIAIAAKIHVAMNLFATLFLATLGRSYEAA